MFKKLAANIGEYKKYVILTPILMIGEVAMEVIIPLIMANIIDNGIRGTGGIRYTLVYGGLMVLLAIISLFCGAMGGRCSVVAGMGFAKNLRNRLFDKCQDFAFSNVDKFSTGSLVTRLTTDVTNTQNAFMMLLRIGARAPMMLIFAFVMSVIINARLALVFVVAIPILGVSLYFICSKAFPRFDKMLKKYDKLNTIVQENLIGIRVVKAFVREDHESEKFKKNADEVRTSQFFAEKLVILNMPIMMICIFGTILAVVFFGGQMVIGNTLEIGQLSSFLTYIMQIMMSLMMLSMIVVISVISYASAKRIGEVLEEEPDIDDPKEAIGMKPQDGSIEFKNVSFSYSNDKDNPTLKNVNLTIKSGETIGIIGGTGSAKTSLVQLIPRLYDVLDGELLVGGHNVKDYKLNDLRSEISMVLQKNVLFSGTIKDNLLWGDVNATDDEVNEACEAAQANEFLKNFPQGLNTDLGQGGVNVSGGQKQRLCIARALLKKPKILILDDSTSAVDTATDSKIRTALKNKLGDTTTIIIAQRISSVCEADRIIVLEDGEINGIGTNDELLANNEIYREVYNSQQKGVED